MSYRHLITVIDNNVADPTPIDFVWVTDDFEAVERLIVEAAKSFMQNFSHPTVYLRGMETMLPGLSSRVFNANYTVDGKSPRESWIETYADQHATIEIPVDSAGSRRFECSVKNASGHTVFFKEIDVSLDIPAFNKPSIAKAA